MIFNISFTMSQQMIEEILEINKNNSQLFCDTIQERRRYRREHPTEFMIMLCMDGRLKWHQLIGLPPGLFYLLRNIGGKYEIGWPLLVETLNEWENYSHRQYRPSVLVITYHWSKGDAHRGCAGFQYKTDEALKHAEKFRKDVIRCYGSRIQPIIIGIETDSEAIRVHGIHGEILDLDEVAHNATEEFLAEHLGQFFPDIPQLVRQDILPILLGNVTHILEVRKNPRPIVELDHSENVLAVGRGFDWIKQPNLALIIGPCDPDLRRAIAVAANIIQNNLKQGRISRERGGVLMSCWPYKDVRLDRPLAVERARYLGEFAMSCIVESAGIDLSDVKDFFQLIIGVLDIHTRKFERIQ
jgi:hypothetical protein